MSSRLELGPEIAYFPEYFDLAGQKRVLAEVLARVAEAPFYRPAMPRSGVPLSVEMTNFGRLGWLTDAAKGYRYEPRHPVTGQAWPDIPEILLDLWAKTTSYPVAPEACLVNFYRAEARMGIHRDEDEEALDAPVLSVSLGASAIFRFGVGTRRQAKTRLQLNSGDVLVFGGPARLMYHGIDRILPTVGTLLPGGARINLTLRRVSKKKATDQGG